MKWFYVHEDEDPPRHMLVWVITKSGTVATGYWNNWWITDGFRVLDSRDSVTHWAHIEYPEFP